MPLEGSNYGLAEDSGAGTAIDAPTQNADRVAVNFVWFPRVEFRYLEYQRAVDVGHIFDGGHDCFGRKQSENGCRVEMVEWIIEQLRSPVPSMLMLVQYLSRRSNYGGV